MMQHKERGTSLIELIVTMGLLSIFLVILTTIFTASVDMQSDSRSYAAVTTDGRFIMARLDYDIKRATNIATPEDPGDTAPSLTLTIGGDEYTYAIDNGRLALTIDSETDYLTGEDSTITSLSFQKLENGSRTSIRYTYTVSAEAAHRTDSQTYTSTTEIRL